MVCKNCGSEIKQGAEFCSNCGNSLNDENVVEEYVAFEAEVSEVYSKPDVFQPVNVYEVDGLDEHGKAVVFADDYEDKAKQIYLQSIFSILLWDLIGFIIAVVSAVQAGKLKREPIFKMSLNDPELIAKCRRAKRKIKIAKILFGIRIGVVALAVALVLLATIFSLAIGGLTTFALLGSNNNSYEESYDYDDYDDYDYEYEYDYEDNYYYY